MNVLITGGVTGFIAINLAKRCLEEGHKVYVTEGINDEKPLPKIEIVSGCFQEVDWRKLGKIDVVYHLAGCTNTMIYDEDYMMKVNCNDAVDFIKEAISHDVKTIVYASSAAVYGKYDGVNSFHESQSLQPLNIYGESKACLDRECQKLYRPGLSLISLRYSNVYGGKTESHKGKTASMVWQLYQQMKTHNPKLFRWGGQARDFVHVSDVVQANILAAQSGKSGIYNIGAGQMWSFNDIVEAINEICGIDRKAEYIDNPIERYYQNYNPVNIDLARRELGYSPHYTLKTGLQAIHNEELFGIPKFKLASENQSNHRNGQHRRTNKDAQQPQASR